jgi:TonB family protein
MNAFIDNSILRARQQEHQKLPKILAYGIGSSLVFHGIAAVALNYLPQPIPAPVEVTLIDPSELPPELKSSPQPPKIKPTPKPKMIAKVTPTPTPSVKVTPTPIPTPSVKIIPTPTPSVKTKPDLTPQVVKIVTKPVIPFVPTQKVTKTAVANDFEKEQNQVRNSLSKNPSQQSQAVTEPSKKQVRSNPDQIPEASSQPSANSSPLNNTQLAFRDPARSPKAVSLSGTEPSSSAGASQSDDQLNNGDPGKGNSSRAATPGNLAAKNIDKTAGNDQPLAAGRTGRSPLARAELSSEAFGGDGSEFAFNPPGSLGSNPLSGSSIGDSGNGQPLASAGTGKLSSSSNGSSAGGAFGDDVDGFAIELSPSNGNISRSTPGSSTGNNGNGWPLARAGTGKFGAGSNSNGTGGIAGDDSSELGSGLSPSNGNISRSTLGGNAGSHGNGRPLASAGTNKFGGVSNGNVADGVSGDGGDEFGTAPIPSRGNSSRSAGGNLSGNGNSRSLISGGNNGLSKNSGANSGNEASGEDLAGTTVPNGKITARNNAQSYITELRCLENCQPNDPGVVSKTTAVRIKLKLDDAGRVADASMIKSGGDQSLDGFAESAFKRMRFELPAGFTKRVFIVTMRFVKSREE